jgi:hypothetical protein
MGAVFFVMLAIRFTGIIAATYRSADVVSAPVIGWLLDAAPHTRDVRLGNFGWYETLWFEQLTAWAPAKRQLWEIGPYLLSLAGAALVTWSTWRVAGRSAAILTGVLLFCQAPGILTVHLAGTLHGMSWWHLALLDAFLVWLLSGTRRRLTSWPAATVVAFFTATGVAADPLAAAYGLAPFALAGAYVLLRERSRDVALPIGLVVVVGAVGARVLLSQMRDAGYTTVDQNVTLVQADHIAANARIASEGLAGYVNGAFFGMQPDARAALTLVCAALGAAAVWRAVRHVRAVVPLHATLSAPGAAHVAFWAIAALLSVAAFVLTSVPVDQFNAMRYLGPTFYAVAVIVPLAAVSDRARLAVTAGACVVIAANIASLVRRDLAREADSFPSQGTANDLVRVARADGLSHGYAAYWDAAPLTWAAQFKVKVYPVSACRGPDSMCRFKFHNISSWYEPRHGRVKTFVLVDPNFASMLPGPPASLGSPSKIVRLYGGKTVYEYDYDVASKITG